MVNHKIQLVKDRSRIIFVIALVAKLTVFALVIWRFGAAVSYTDTDARQYLTAGLNFFQHGVFSASSTAPFVPIMFRTPLYSIVLAILHGISAHWWPVFVWLLQDGVMALVAVFMYRELNNYTNERRAFYATLFFAVEPYGLLNGNIATPESLFTACIIVASFLFLRYYRLRNVKTLIWSAIFLSLAILIKPIAQFLPLLTLAGIAMFIRPRRLSIKHGLIFVSVCLLVLAPWLTRNLITFNRLDISSLPSYNLYFYNAAAVVAAQQHIGTATAQTLLLQQATRDTGHTKQDDYFDPKFGPYLRSAALTIIVPHWWLYTRIHLLSLLPFFLNDGYQKLYPLFGITLHNTTSVTLLAAQGQWREITTYVFGRGGLTVFLFSLGKLIWLVVYIGIIVRLRQHWRNKNRAVIPVIIMCFCLIIYFAVLTGPVAAAPYRLPVQSFIFSLLFI